MVRWTVQKRVRWEAFGRELIQIILEKNRINIIYLTPKCPKDTATSFSSFFERPSTLCSQPNLSIQGQHFPLLLFNLKEMPRLGLHMKVPGLTSQGPLLILRITAVLCVVDAQITITQYPVYLRPK